MAAPGPEGTKLEIPEIDIAEAARRIHAGTPVFDVREPDEYTAGHVPGAPLIPLGSLADHLDRFPTDREILLICRSGGRSHHAAKVLRSRGIDAINVDGGTDGWIAAGHPVVEGDEPGAVPG